MSQKVVEQISKRASQLLSSPTGKSLLKEVKGQAEAATEAASAAAPVGPGQIPIASTALFAGLLLLFSMAIYRAVGKRGTGNCGNGWLVIMLMPILVAAGMSIYVGWDNSRRGLMYAPNPYRIMAIFTAILAVLQYVLSVVFTKLNRPNVGWGSAARRSIITVIFTLIPSLIGMVSYYLVTVWMPNALPGAGKAIQKTIDMIPFLSRIYKSQAHWLSAWGFGSGALLIWVPVVGILLMPVLNFVPFTPLLSLTGYGFACRGAK